MPSDDDKLSKVLLTTSIIVDVPEDEDGNSDRMESITEKFLDAVWSAFSDDPSVSADGGIAYHWFSDPATNVGRCVRCRRWASDWQAPDALRDLVPAMCVDGQLVCDECRHVGDQPQGE